MVSEHIGLAWAALREPLMTLSFREIKEAAASSGLPTEKLSHLSQTSNGRSSSKAELIDGVDSLFNKLDREAGDRATVNLIAELIQRRPQQKDRMAELLGRRGWDLSGDDPVPVQLSAAMLSPTDVPGVAQGMVKAIHRFRDGDYDGAMTSVVGLVDKMTENLYSQHGLEGHRSDNFHKRVTESHKLLKSEFQEMAGGLDSDELSRAWGGLVRSINGAAEVLAVFRRNYSDVHGIAETDRVIVHHAFRAALFVVGSLQMEER